MTDLNLSMELGPQYEILVQTNEPFTIEVGTATGGGSGGTSSGTLDVAITAGETINAYSGVGYDGLKTTNTVNSLSNYAGIARYALTNGESASVVRSGLLTDMNWTWTPNAPVFISATGMLTQTAPTSGAVRRVGWAITSTQLNLDPYPIIGV